MVLPWVTEIRSKCYGPYVVKYSNTVVWKRGWKHLSQAVVTYSYTVKRIKFGASCISDHVLIKAQNWIRPMSEVANLGCESVGRTEISHVCYFRILGA